jgi:MinD superfamily P-loop ATPase
MREILIISGKGGTGKTSITGAFSHLAGNHVVCDLDVDAPDLHLLLQPKIEQSHEFWSGHTARIAQARCTQCGECKQLCRFDAIQIDASHFRVNPMKCEGCKVCVALCPAEAVDFEPDHCGDWYVSHTRFGPMLHAHLFPAQENSGRLVALIRKEARKVAVATNSHLILSDGPPGIGCPVISAFSGTHMAVIVTEPTPSGIHDLERIEALCNHFSIPAAVIINKWNLAPSLSEAISRHCQDMHIPVVARLPHDPAFTHAMLKGQTVTEYGGNALTSVLEEAWKQILILVEHPKVSATGDVKIQQEV